MKRNITISLLIAVLVVTVGLVGCKNAGELQSIEVKDMPQKLEYVIGEEINLGGGKLSAVYGEKDVRDVDMKDDEVKITGFDNTTAGTQTITVTYMDKTTTFEVTVKEPVVASIKVTTAPQVNIVAGEAVFAAGGKIKVSYANQTDQTLDVDPTWITELNLFAKKATISYGGKTAEATLQFDAVTVTDEAALVDALMSDALLVLVANKNYELSASLLTTYVLKPKVIVGEGEAIINISNSVSSQASLVFNDSVTLKNLIINAEGTHKAVKISNISGEKRIEKAYLCCSQINGAKGLDVNNVEACTIKNCSITVAEELGTVALAIAQSGVDIVDCQIGGGTWGSIGVMYKDTYEDVTTLSIDDKTSISKWLYVEEFDKSTEDGATLQYPEGWTAEMDGQTKLFYPQTVAE